MSLVKTNCTASTSGKRTRDNFTMHVSLLARKSIYATAYCRILDAAVLQYQ